MCVFALSLDRFRVRSCVQQAYLAGARRLASSLSPDMSVCLSVRTSVGPSEEAASIPFLNIGRASKAFFSLHSSACSVDAAIHAAPEPNRTESSSARAPEA